jgi:protein-L-isoaspartate(D-aspartate) O-methyltransferase
VSRGVGSGTLRRRLARALQEGGWIRSARVRDAFLAVPRELFVPEYADEQGLEAVYRDESILTKQDPHGVPLSSSSQPAIMAAMLERLQLEERMRVLEIGAGTGYNAALLSVLVGPRGRVVSVEVDPDLARKARRNLRSGGYKARVVVGDGREGCAELAPYDGIIVTASSRSVPIAWFEQLEPRGLVEVPLQLSAAGAQAIPLLQKTRRGFRSTGVIAGGFMPLRTAGQDVSPRERPGLVASSLTPEGELPLQQLYGEAVGALSPRAKRRLLSISLGPSRHRRLGLRARSSALALFLSLELPERQLIFTLPRLGIGVIPRSGGSLALIEPPVTRRTKTISSFRLFGGDEAEELLLKHVRDWDRRGRPAESDLAITVGYHENGTSKLRYRWPRR